MTSEQEKNLRVEARACWGNSARQTRTRLQAASKDIHVFVKMAARMSASKLRSRRTARCALASRFAQLIRQAIAGQIMMRLAPILRHLWNSCVKDKQLADFSQRVTRKRRSRRAAWSLQAPGTALAKAVFG